MENIFVNYAPEGREKRITEVHSVGLREPSVLTYTSARIAMKLVPSSTGVLRQQCAYVTCPRTQPFSPHPYALLTTLSLGANTCASTKVITLIWGDNFFIFKPPPRTPHDSVEYILNIPDKHHIFCGSCSRSFGKLCGDDRAVILLNSIMSGVPPVRMNPFPLASKQEISTEDKEEFILKTMKTDPTDRLPAKNLPEV
ncbi:hypothetical protein ACJ72_04755 [Emergomyces africanus]|uniref:Uncharacterized protein n=1 Tax=Emergomyces africanus TaxID=1955775 RepID=A0A1B7NWB4_9EURO|nr:hypothetical protein ACJ72_04755 [Emergomyces africanus]